MKYYIGLLLCVMALATGCKTTAKQATYNTLYSLEKTTTAAFDSYISLVIDKKVNADYLPAVSSHYNKFQAAMTVAVDIAQHNTDTAAPDYLVVESQDVIHLITLAKGGAK